MSLTTLRPFAIARVILPTRHQASTFATSSRVGLDFTLPRRNIPPQNSATSSPISKPTTTLLDNPPHLEQPATATSNDSNPAPPPTLNANTGQKSSPTAKTPQFDLSTPRSQPSSSTSPTSAFSSRPTRNLSKSELAATLVATIPAPSGTGLLNLRYSPQPPTFGNDTSTHDTHTLHVFSSRNNVILTFTDAQGPLWQTITGGSGLQFKKSTRSSYEAAHQATLKVIRLIEDYSKQVVRVRVKVCFRGMFGQGREAVAAALSGPEGLGVQGLIGRVEDVTRVAIGGPRPRKARRI